MAIKKQDFYEGAAVFQLLKTNKVKRVVHEHPFLILNDEIAIIIKYSTSKDSPWNFAFSLQELPHITQPKPELRNYLGLVCGSDGIVTLTFEQFHQIAEVKNGALRIGCYRKYDKYYQINGPRGSLDKKIAPSLWTRLLDSDI